MQLSRLLAVAKRWWWLLLASTAVAAVAGYTVVSSQPPRYESSVRLLVGPINTDLNTIRAAGQLAQTYAEFAASRPLLDDAAKALGVSAVDAEVSAAANDVTRLLTVRVSDSSSTRAPALANELADDLAALGATGTAGPEGALRVIQRAESPAIPAKPDVVWLTLLAALTGLAGSLVLAVGVEALRKTVASTQELGDLAQANVLGSFDGSRLVDPLTDAEGARAYRLLAAEVELARGRKQPVRSLIVLGAQGGEGAGTVAVNLASAAADSGRRVTLVDGDAAEGEATALLGLDGQLGMTELVRNASLPGRGDELLRHLRLRQRPGLDVLPQGTPDGPDLVDADRARQILDRLLSQSDLVIVATPPIRRSPSGLAWACAVDAALLVASREATRRESVSQTVQSLRRVGADIAGAVFSTPGGRRRGATASARRRRRPGSPDAEARRATGPEPSADRQRQRRPEMVATSLFARADTPAVRSQTQESVEDGGRG